MKKIKVRLTKNVPVDEKHGLTAGKEIEVECREDGYWFLSEGDEDVRVFPYEFKVIKGGKNDA